MVKKIAGIFLAIILVTLLSLNTVAIAVGPPLPPKPDITVIDSVLPVDDQDIPFGNVSIGSTSDKTVTVTNSGNVNLSIGQIANANPLASPFSILNENCSNIFLAPAGNCTITVRFDPTSTTTVNDSFDIPSDDPDEGTVNVALSGTGFSIHVNNSPSAPQLVYPENAENCSRTTEKFIWGKSIDPDGDNVTYDLQICEDNNFTTGCIPKENIAFLGNTVNKGIYYAGSSMGLLLFGIVIAGSVRDKRRVALLLVMIIIVAILSVSCGSSSSDPVCNPPNIPNSDPSSEITQEASGLKGGTTYYWKVIADDGNGGVTESKVRNFIAK